MLAFLPSLIGGAFRFFTSPAGKYALIVLAFVAWSGYMRHDAANKARKTCLSEQYKKEAEAYRLQVAAVKASAARATVRADATEQELADVRKIRDELLADLDKVEETTDGTDTTKTGKKCDPNAGRMLPDDLRQRLLKLRP